MSVRSRQWSWALIDWANSAYTLVVITVFFPLLFKSYWAGNLEASRSTFWLGLFSSAASLCMALLAPWLGSLADRKWGKARPLLLFTALGSGASLALAFFGPGQWLATGLLFSLGSLAFNINNMFYDSLLSDVAGPKDWDRVSALGYALGYFGSTLLFVLCAWAYAVPASFGMASPEVAARWAMAATGFWWLAFTLPAYFSLGKKAVPRSKGRTELGLRQSMALALKVKGLGWFLAAYFLYIDGVNTIIKMAFDFGLSLNLPAGKMILAILLVQVVGVPATLGFGRLAKSLGARRAIFIAIGVYGLTCLWAIWVSETWHFMAMACLIGLVQGGIQSLSRSYFLRYVPAGKSGQYFGIFNVVGRFSAIAGPALMGVTAMLSGSNRAAVLSLLLLFGAGALALQRSKEPKLRAAS